MNYCILYGAYRQLELYEELHLVRQFEKTENDLYEKLQEKVAEKLNIDKLVGLTELQLFTARIILWL